MTDAMTDVKPYPDELKPYWGELMDVDAHEQLPAQVWEQEMGPALKDLATYWLNMEDNGRDRHHPNVPGYVKDDAPINAETIWKQKGPPAPAAADLSRRPQVMDLMGIKRQLIFPTMGIQCAAMIYLPPEHRFGKKIRATYEERRAYGFELLKAYNDWGIRVAKHSDRVRPVLPIYSETVEGMIAEARRLIDNGIRAIWLLSGEMPGGRSPAHPDLDPFWSLMEDNNVAVCLHVSSRGRVFVEDWADAPAFKGFTFLGEFDVDPWSTAHFHTLAENFLLTMVLGGVFERHPMLRFGCIELGAGWIGPLCERLDMWYGLDIARVNKDGRGLPHPPSFYVKRNVRVTGFDFEPFGRYLRNYDLEDVLCFASDYPHVEGGEKPLVKMYDEIAPLGEHVVKKFFVENGKWLLPD